MAVIFMLALAVVQANQCSSGAERPSDNEPQNIVSLIQTKLQMNVLEDGPPVTTNRSVVPTELKGMVHSAATPAVDLVEAGSDSTRMATCFPKAVDVCFDGCKHDANGRPMQDGNDEKFPCNAPAVCEQFKFADLHYNNCFDQLHLGYDPDSRTLCIAGNSYQTRALSTVKMIKDAVRSLDKDCKSLSLFRDKVIWVQDTSDCSHDLAYSAKKWTNGCKTKLIPDFALYKWPEAGLLPDYTELTSLLASLGSHPAKDRRCGWAGNKAMNPVREEFAKKFKNSPLFDIVTPEVASGQGNGRISMEDQVTQWACFVELPGMGYSGRVPYLLQSGRPILMVEPRPGPMAPTWYSHLLEPWVHYIPVSHDMSDLAEKAAFALGITPGSNATKIAAAAQEFAQTHLSYDAAINYLANSLLELQQAS